MQQKTPPNERTPTLSRQGVQYECNSKACHQPTTTNPQGSQRFASNVPASTRSDSSARCTYRGGLHPLLSSRSQGRSVRPRVSSPSTEGVFPNAPRAAQADENYTTPGDLETRKTRRNSPLIDAASRIGPSPPRTRTPAASCSRGADTACSPRPPCLRSDQPEG